MAVKLLRCRICGDLYIGEKAPSRCPFCGANSKFIVDAKKFKETFDVELNETDNANVQKALELEISNASFYFCASDKTNDAEGKQLFKALGKVEAEHAAIWKKILKLEKIDIPKSSDCSEDNRTDLQESNARESRAIDFYKRFAKDAKNARVKQLFNSIVLVEKDHLQLSEKRLK